MVGVTSRQIELGGARVDLWQVVLSAAHDAAYPATLAPDETARAERFISDVVRQHFITARGVLRAILAEYLSTDPAMLEFEYGTRGKPALGGQWHDNPLRFNLSHSEDCMFLGVTWRRAIGVDVEYMHHITDTDQIAAQFFAPEEYAIYKYAPETLQRQAFFNCWTRKEAYIKARGDGLALPLADFAVTLLPDDPPQLVCAKDDDPARWTLHAELLSPDYVIAVMVERA